ncbi:CBS domain-containing protein [Polaribacter sp. HL-MS24]|uniref:CBS domain-containing protein n=1 Tax=Polaribacter sp. HL-MS24 TaxID=3077735 RepID=UPI002934FB9E|nr:CBS domain-containing protein [Polaribacter sp. HL-MS24]WOC40107.1 CBS domain-containing protein [Polaribacter sp. HL-MS24]
MGSQSVIAIKTKKQRKEFVRHLLNDIEAFEYMLQHQMFETGIQRVGVEQELCLVDKDFRPSTTALEILEKMDDKHYTTELALFNLEINLDPFELTHTCFSDLEKQLIALLEKGSNVAEQVQNTKLILAGILPTLKKKDLVFKNVTPFKRYKTLNSILKKIRGEDFKIHIQGVDELILKHESILFEACNTSFQVHLQICPEEAIDKYNWSQAIAGPILSIMTNSPILLGKELWSETRIALFQQSIDLRNISHISREQRARVSFGESWVKESILELFTDDISRYPPIVSSKIEEDSLELVQQGIMPKLMALNLHNGTLYKWNRLCYGVHDNIAHIRIENRYIPAGPSVKDEIANALLWVGVMQGMPKQYEKIWRKMPFNDARGNFINAARTGMDSYFNWFGKGMSAKKLLETVLIPMAKEGLLKSNIDETEIDHYLEIIQKRIDTNTTGSKWLIRNKRTLRAEFSNYESNVILTENIHKNQQDNIPISEWKPVEFYKNDSQKKYDKVYKIMSTHLYVVHENDLLKLVSKIMEWKKVHHIPVVNSRNRIVGIIDKSQLEEIDFSSKNTFKTIAKNIMNTNFGIANPDMSYQTAKNIMNSKKNTAIVVVNGDLLVGIITKSDFEKIEQIKKTL